MEPNRPKQPMSTPKSGSPWMVVGIVIVVAIIVGIYFLTRPSPENNNLPSDVPLNSDIGSSVLGTDRTAVNAIPKSLEVVNMGTFPYKVQAKVSVDLPNSCSSATGNVTQSGKVFTVTTAASQPKDAMCAQVITSSTVTVDIPVTGIAAGTYTVKYEAFSKTFTLAQNNTVEYTSDK